jgi:hypothetical protein
MKQSSIEWLMEIDKSRAITIEEWQQAREMEKVQIGRAYQEGLLDGLNHTPKDYYNETFNING